MTMRVGGFRMKKIQKEEIHDAEKAHANHLV